MRLSEDFLLRIKESNDIYDVISSYIPLKKTGSDYVCCCPFHSEKTPSCHIYMATQSFYCFGCGAAGDVINFIRLYEHLDYMESIRLLAQRAGIAMPEDGGDDEGRRRTRLLEMNREAGKFYHKLLFSPKGREGLEYLRSRGLTEHTIRVFGLGYAPEDWTMLRDHLEGAGFKDTELEEGSLAVRSAKTGKYYDFFRYRVMFPFFDMRGNIVGFSGRVIGGDDTRKYLNTKTTPVYNKSTFLYSMNHAKNTNQSNLIMCEGNIDVISLYQAGFKNAVATCGTAMTDSHARVIANQGFREVTLSYDSDAAGQKATARALNILDKVGLNAKILTIKGAKDPDEFIQKYGKDAFALLISESESGMDFELDKLRQSVDLSTPQGKSEFLKKASAFIAGISNSLDRAVYISTIAQECGVSRSNVEAAVSNIMKSIRRDRDRKLTQQALYGTARHGNISGNIEYPPILRAERGIIAFLFNSPDYAEKISSKIVAEDFTDDFNKRLYTDLLMLIGQNLPTDISTLGEKYAAEEISCITKLIHDNNELPYSLDRLNDYIGLIIKNKERKNRKSAADMTTEELLDYAGRIRSGKN